MIKKLIALFCLILSVASSAFAGVSAPNALEEKLLIAIDTEFASLENDELAQALGKTNSLQNSISKFAHDPHVPPDNEKTLKTVKKIYVQGLAHRGKLMTRGYYETTMDLVQDPVDWIAVPFAAVLDTLAAAIVAPVGATHDYITVGRFDKVVVKMVKVLIVTANERLERDRLPQLDLVQMAATIRAFPEELGAKDEQLKTQLSTLMLELAKPKKARHCLKV